MGSRKSPLRPRLGEVIIRATPRRARRGKVRGVSPSDRQAATTRVLDGRHSRKVQAGMPSVTA